MEKEKNLTLERAELPFSKSSQGCAFPVVLCGCESWTIKKAEIYALFFLNKFMLLNCVLEKTLESPLDREEIQSVHPKGNQS